MDTTKKRTEHDMMNEQNIPAALHTSFRVVAFENLALSETIMNLVGIDYYVALIGLIVLLGIEKVEKAIRASYIETEATSIVKMLAYICEMESR